MSTPTNELYQPLIEAYNHFNLYLFEKELPPVIFTLQRKKHVAGFFSAQRWGNLNGRTCSEIAINPAYFADSRMIEVMQTLVHEMVHAWQYHFGSPSDNHYHNKEWAHKMMLIGLMPSSTGEPGGDVVGRQMSDFIIKEGAFLRVAKLLIEGPGFSLLWVDRLAMPRLKEPIIADVKVTKNDKAADNINADDMTYGIDPFTPTESLYDYFSDLPGESREAANETLPTSFFFPHTELARKPSRYKYTCPGCNTKVYGRLGLNLLCCDCEMNFSMQE